MDKCTEIFLLVIFPLIRQVIVCSIKKRFSCDESRLQSDNPQHIYTDEGVSKNIHLSWGHLNC